MKTDGGTVLRPVTLIVGLGLVFAALSITPASAQWGDGYRQGYGHWHGWARGNHRGWYPPYGYGPHRYWRQRYWRRGW